MKPKLRFKEFTGDWEEKKLSNNFTKIIEKNKGKKIKNVISNSAKLGLIQQEEYFLRDIANKDNIDSYYIIEKNDFVYNPRKSMESPYGPINIYKMDKKGVVSPLYLCFRLINKENQEYYNHYFKSDKWHQEIYKVGDLGARYDRISIRDMDFFNITIVTPSLYEQNKISNFLSTVDEKILNQQEKITHLENIKKGFMQKIFSRKIRFKDHYGNEFPEWKEKKLGEISRCLDNKRIPISSTERIKGIVPYYGANGIQDYVNDYIFDGKYVLLAEDGGNFNEFYSKPIAQYVEGKCWINNHAHILESKECTKFLYYSLVHKDIRKYINGTSRSKLNQADMVEIKIKNPCLEEQQKIADFLSLFDEKIDVEKDTLEHLKEMKKGLLQQMFV